MADTSIAITQGTGTSIDTRTEATNGNHRQVIVIGDPSVNAGVAPVDATSGLKVHLGADNDVVVTSSALPTGAATSAKQDTIIGHVDGIEGLLTNIDADTSALAGAVAGTEVQVDIVSAPTLNVNPHNVTNAGTFAVQESGAALTALQIMDDWDNAASDGASVSGDVAHDAVDAGEPVKVGAKAETSLAGVTLVADGDRTNLYADADGVQYVRPQAPLADHISEAVSNTDGASTAFTNFGATASAYNYVTGYHIFRTDSGTSPIYVDFRDGTSGSVLWRVVIPPNGGANSPYNAGMPLFHTSANTALAYDVSTPTTTVYINVSGFKSKIG